VEANQAWAKAAPVLDLGVVNLRFAKNNQDNRAAIHDLGLAAGNLVAEATARGLSVHQMIGILPDKAREVQAKWQYGRRYVNQMISAAQVFNHLGVFSSLKPEHQSQVQPLSGLTPEQAQRAWQCAVENAGGRRITARMVKSAVNQLGLAPQTQSGRAPVRTAQSERRLLINRTLSELLKLISDKAGHDVLLEKARALETHLNPLLGKK
jgi:hypothetical protein